MNTSTIVRNPWTIDRARSPLPPFVYNSPPVFSHRGVDVYRNHSSFDYVLGDCAITQRDGFSRDRGRKIIDATLDGDTTDPTLFPWVCYEVAKHLKKHGHSPATL